MKNFFLFVVLAGVIGFIWYLQGNKVKPKETSPAIDISLPTPIQTVTSTTTTPAGEKPKPLPVDNKYPAAKEITTPDGFINTPPFKLADLIGKKIILVDFWTYSCINCQRTTPYLNAWYEKYKDQGLVIVGIHTPEFEFEKNYDNVKKAVANEQIKFPVVLDNDYSTWTAYGNLYWPRKYLINREGRIVYDHIGEGAYAETEMKIKELLGDLDQQTVKPAEASGPSAEPITGEIYFGSKRNNNFLTGLKLIGDWNIAPEFAENKQAGDKITILYRAKKVFFVAGADKPVSIEVRQDGKTVKTLTIKDETIYPLITNPVVEPHQLEIIIQAPGLHAYTFTFG